MKKWITDLDLRAKTIKFLEKNMKANIHDFGFSKVFLYITPKTQATKGKINLTSLKLKTFVHQRILSGE